MSTLTISAQDVFAPTTPAGQPRGAAMTEVRTWATEVERILQAASASGGALVFNLRSVMNASLGYGSNTMAWVVGDPTSANNGIYLKTGGVGSGAWARVGDLPYQVITLSVGGTPDALTASSVLPVPATDRAALLIFNTPAANSGPATMAINGGAPLPILDRYGNALTANFFAPGGAAMGVRQGGAIRTFLDTDAGVARAAAEAARDIAVDAKDDAVDAKADAEAARHAVQAVILGAGPAFPTVDGNGDPVQDYARFILTGQPSPEDNGEYYRLAPGWERVPGIPAGSFRRAGHFFVTETEVETGYIPVSSGYVPGTIDIFRNGRDQLVGETPEASDLGADCDASDGVGIQFPTGVLKVNDIIRWRALQPRPVDEIAAGDVDFAPTTEVTESTVQGAIAGLGTGKVPNARTITGGGLVTGGGDLSANRTLTVTAASSAETIAGTLESKATTPKGVKDAIQDALTGGAVPSGAVIKVLSDEYTANANITTIIPYDDTVPLSSEGTQILSITHTLAAENSKVALRFSGAGAMAGAGPNTWVAAIFRGTTCLRARGNTQAQDYIGENNMAVIETPGSVGPHTWTVRVGPGFADTLRLNGNSSARRLGGAQAATLILEEIKG